MSYMGDRKSSKKDNLAHAQCALRRRPAHFLRKLIKNAFSHPAGLRDEIFLQLVKQTTRNPRMYVPVISQCFPYGSAVRVPSRAGNCSSFAWAASRRPKQCVTGILTGLMHLMNTDDWHLTTLTDKEVPCHVLPRNCKCGND